MYQGNIIFLALSLGRGHCNLSMPRSFQSVPIPDLEDGGREEDGRDGDERGRKEGASQLTSPAASASDYCCCGGGGLSLFIRRWHRGV